MKIRRLAKITLLAFVLLFGLVYFYRPVAAQSASPRVGQEEWRKVRFEAAANWDECKQNNPVYQLQPGWVLVDWELEVQVRYGRSTVNMSFLQANGYYRAYNSHINSFDNAINAAYEKGLESYAGELEYRKETYVEAMTSAATSHSAIQVKAEACGSGNLFDQKGGSIKGNLWVKIGYVGTPGDVNREVNLALTRIKGREPVARMIWVSNRCQDSDERITRVAIKYLNPDREWDTAVFSTNIGSNISVSLQKQTPSTAVYYYAAQRDGDQYAGEYKVEVGGRVYPMRLTTLRSGSNGKLYLRLGC